MTDPDLTVGAVLTDDLRDWLMAELRYPVIAVIAEDGSPSQSVMWFDLDPEDPNVIVMNTKRGRAKDRWLRRDPRISLCFEDGTDYVTIEGRAELFDDREKALENIWAMARRYGQGEGSFAMGDRVDITVHVERVIRHR